MEVGGKIERVRGCQEKDNWKECWVTGSRGVHLPAWWQAMAPRHSKAFFWKSHLLTVVGTKHFSEIIFLFVALASYSFNAIGKAWTGEARVCGGKNWWLMKRIKSLPKWEGVSCCSSAFQTNFPTFSPLAPLCLLRGLIVLLKSPGWPTAKAIYMCRSLNCLWHK